MEYNRDKKGYVLLMYRVGSKINSIVNTELRLNDERL